MARETLTVIELAGSARERGLAHGEECADQIREYASQRVELVSGGTWNGRPLEREQALALAESCIPAHDAYSSELTDELRGIAEASGCTVGELVIAGGFTDFVDTVYGELGRRSIPEDDCTAALIPEERADGAGLLVQTWDMHASALDYVVLLDIRPDDGPRALMLSTTGCLGQIGMNEAGICVGINNLMGADGRIGVTWPHVVRQALLATEIDEALACILGAELAGAHNYLLLDGDGCGYNVEAFSTTHRVTELGRDALVHTNHALADETLALSQERPPELQASSERRFAHATAWLSSDGIGFDDIVELTRHPTLCYPPAPPLAMATCGAVIMRPRTLDFWACEGPPDANEYEHFSLPRPRASATRAGAGAP
jgi:isopenicillin-N N-acyltransferase-like protein